MTDRDSSSLQRPVRSAEDIEALSAHDRLLLARWLAHSAQCDDIVVSRSRRRIGLAMTFGGIVLLIAWSGFDVALTVAFAFAAVAGWRRRQIVITALTVLGVLLLCDAWFDLTLSWGTSDQAGSVLTALVAEVPVAIVAFALGHRLLRETVHYVWHLEGREHPVPPLRRIPIIFVPSDQGVYAGEA